MVDKYLSPTEVVQHQSMAEYLDDHLELNESMREDILELLALEVAAEHTRAVDACAKLIIADRAARAS